MDGGAKEQPGDGLEAGSATGGATGRSDSRHNNIAPWAASGGDSCAAYPREPDHGEPAGLSQYSLCDPAPEGPWSREPAGTVGIDYLLARPEDLGKGLGKQLIRDFVRFIETQHGPTRIIADPVPENEASIRALLACGFRRDEGSGLFVLREKETNQITQ